MILIDLVFVFMYTLLFVATVGNSAVLFGIKIKFLTSENASSLNFSQISTSNVYNLFNFVQTAIQGVHVLEYCVLMWSLVQFHRRIIKTEERCESEELNTIGKKLKKEILSLIQCEECNDVVTFLKDHYFEMILSMLIYPAIFLAPLILYELKRRYSSNSQFLSQLYLGTLFVDYISAGVVRIILITVTLLIKGMWKAACVKVLGFNSYDEFKDVLKTYDETGELISPLQDIFKNWFVLQWIVYFVEITQFCMLFFDLQVYDIDEEPNLILNESAALPFTILLFHITTFAIPYFCGISMNSCHEAYLQTSQKQQKKILSQSPTDNVFWLMQNAKLVPKNAKYQFVPSLGGLTIPLDNTGHFLTIVMALLVFWLSLVSKWVSKDI